MRSTNRAGFLRFALRSRLRYSVRSLLFATLIICLTLGWYVERVRRQLCAVEALTADGAAIYYYDDDNLFFEAKDFNEGRIVEKPRTFLQWVEFLTPARLRTALGIDFFRRVDTVWSPNHCDFPHDATVFSQLPGLRTLALYYALDEDLAALGDLSDLTNLDLQDSVISDAGLAHLGRLHNLESLSIYCGHFHQYVNGPDDHTMPLPRAVTDAGLAHLAGLRRLKYLCLCCLGLGYFSRYSVTIDFPNSVVYLRPGKAFTRPDDYDLSCLAVSRTDDSILVAATHVGGAAAAAGIKKDDRVLLIDSHSTRAMSLFRFRRFLHIQGTHVLEIDRNGMRQRIVLALTEESNSNGTSNEAK